VPRGPPRAARRGCAVRAALAWHRQKALGLVGPGWVPFNMFRAVTDDTSWNEEVTALVALPFVARLVAPLVDPACWAAVKLLSRVVAMMVAAARGRGQQAGGLPASGFARSSKEFRGFTSSDVSRRGSSWDLALARSGHSNGEAVLAAAARLLLLHWLQPVVFLAALQHHGAELDQWQVSLMYALATKEIMYLVETLSAPV
jgi:hypothetical protein